MNQIWEDKIARLAIKISLFLLLASFFLIALFWSRLPPKIPLFYSRPWGEEQIAQPEFLLLLPASVLVVLIANLMLSQVSLGEKLLFRIQMVAVAIFALFVFLALSKIIFLVI